jgi:hypothetical protein
MYYLFVGDNYYPSSGLGDYHGKYDTQEEASVAGKALVEASKYSNDWYTIITVTENGDLTEIENGWKERR